MSEELFNPDKFTSDLQERLAQPLPELERDSLYANLIKIDGNLSRILRQSDGVLAYNKADGTVLTSDERQLLIRQRDGLKENISLMLGKVQKAKKVIFSPPFNLDGAGSEPSASTDTEERFAAVEHADLTSDDFTNWRKIIAEAEIAVLDVNAFKDSFEKNTHTFTVPNAINPYRKAMLESGIPNIETNPLAAERKDTKVDLEKILAENQQSYRDMGLSVWADNLAKTDLKNLTPEKRETIEKEIAAGAILIYMPDKATQLATTVDQIRKSFKPVMVKNGQEQAVCDASLYGVDLLDLTQNHLETVVFGIPGKSYISLMKPSQSPEDVTLRKDRDEQLNQFFEMNLERYAKLPPVDEINLFEYGALQIIYSRKLRDELAFIGKPQNINPIDTNTSTRFIHMLASWNGAIPCANFNLVNAQLNFGLNNARYREDNVGFRLTVRIEL